MCNSQEINTSNKCCCTALLYGLTSSANNLENVPRCSPSISVHKPSNQQVQSSITVQLYGFNLYCCCTACTSLYILLYGSVQYGFPRKNSAANSLLDFCALAMQSDLFLFWNAFSLSHVWSISSLARALWKISLPWMCFSLFPMSH